MEDPAPLCVVHQYGFCRASQHRRAPACGRDSAAAGGRHRHFPDQCIQTLPSELEEAARMDDLHPDHDAASRSGSCRYRDLFLPALLELVYLAAHCLAENMFTLQVVLSFIHTGEFGTNYGLLLSGASLAAIPMIIFFFAFHKYFMQGLWIGAAKG